jgi:cold shock protein
MSLTGTIKFFNQFKGFGFVSPSDGSEDLFVHINDVEGNPPQENDEVQFDSE